MSHHNQRHMHLGAFLFQVGHHVAAWRYPETDAHGILTHTFYENFAQLAERGKFDMIFLADTLAVVDRGQTGIKHTVSVRPEPLTLLAYLSGVTKHIGLAATVSTTYNEPYNLAREFSTLDHLSGGRAAWNVVTSGRDEEAHNFSLAAHPGHEERYERAREFVDIANALWDSWEDDAIIGDKQSEQFADPDKVHELHHRGQAFSVRGPLNLPRSPQGRPVIIQAGASETGRRLAAETAEVVFTAWQTLEEAQRFYREVKSLAVANGRPPEDIKIMPGIYAVIGTTEEEARAKEAALQDQVLPAVGLSMLSASLNVDLTGYPLDGPLPDLPELASINGGKSRFQLVSEMAKREGLTIRQLIYRVTGARGHRTIAGTPSQIADQLEEWFTQGACDGFNIMPPTLPGGLEEFVEHVIPELQRRGLFRTAYTGTTLREHLGLVRPVSQFAKGTSTV
ncbi:LLM class flavin-dependent oxidoreductase [Paenibacillus qinlingensis]|uniref:FMN-dependent oxidoreductase (Nitrilotriacetate monooxygenase family) n=1 Tax=Paenibacillus qinlingensis TaxID=1837343 RepID=A0ABU1NU80_9BACL|nr:LLM class flavin-dependent oxidoreductase [Paenibacillus qinlingensis]MDR6550547.1 FMN-dependent oxidoreductase (nitrilotriacetate monooxygenase family) [Paenibacillus qinlingensis]